MRCEDIQVSSPLTILRLDLLVFERGWIKCCKNLTIINMYKYPIYPIKLCTYDVHY